MQSQDTNNQVTTMTSMQGMQGSATAQNAQMQGAAQAMQSQAAPGQMPGVQQAQQQVEQLRETLRDLMMNQQYADGEIVSASADLDQQLQNYSRILSDKKQPSMRTF